MKFTKAIGFKGYYPDLPPDMCPEGAVVTGSKNFRIVQVLIRKDNDSGRMSLEYGYDQPDGNDGQWRLSDTTNVYLARNNDGTFDNEDYYMTYYDQAAYNRGWITIWYEE